MSVVSKVKEWVNGLSVIAKDGSEIPDPHPVEIPVGFERPESIQETIRRLVTDPQIRAELQGQDIETFDDADDFDIADDEPVSPHEDSFDPLHLLAREQEVNAGAVKPRTPEEILAAQRAIEEVRAKSKAEPKVPPLKDGVKPADA